MTGHPARRTTASIAVALIVGTSNPPPALAITPPTVDPSAVPGDSTPGPERPMRQTAACRTAVAGPHPDITLPTPGFAMLNIARAWHHSTGNGVRVAVIDSGVNPNPRLPVVPGGDYVQGGNGLSDCDVHGTVVAAIIAAAPAGVPMPAAMPPTAPRDAVPPPAGPAAPPPAGPAAPSTTSTAAPPPTSTAPLPVPVGQDGLAGVAPHATVISVRQSSTLFAPADPGPGGLDSEKAGTVATLARAIVHAANLGAGVINVSVTACLSAADPLDLRALGAAVWFAATVKNSVVIAAAGNEGEDGCAANPKPDPSNPDDPRDWHHVKTVSAPSWFADYVLSVGAVDTTGAPISASLAGPWVGVAAPGVGIVGLSGPAGAVNAYSPARPGDPSVPFTGTSFAAAYVSGVAALVRAKFPTLSAHEVIDRIQRTAHSPAGGVDNQVGYGVVDPLAALTFDVVPAERATPGALSRVVSPPAAPPPPDHRARTVALGFAAAVTLGVLLSVAVTRARRAR